MNILSELIRVNAPLVAVVDPDLIWARSWTLRSIKALGTQAGRRLEWTAARGWHGSEDLMHSSGLPSIVSSRTNKVDVSHYLDQFGSWLGGVAEKVEGDLDASPFKRGIAVIHDLHGSLDAPVVTRLLLDLVEILPDHQATVVLVLPERLPVDHPLQAAVVQVAPQSAPGARFGTMAAAFAEQFADLVGSIEPDAISEALGGLSSTVGETVLRLAAGRMLDGPGDSDGSPSLLDVIADVRASLD